MRDSAGSRGRGWPGGLTWGSAIGSAEGNTTAVWDTGCTATFLVADYPWTVCIDTYKGHRVAPCSSIKQPAAWSWAATMAADSIQHTVVTDSGSTSLQDLRIASGGGP